MVTAAEIGWGKYKQYSGPFYRGKFSYTLPQNPTPADLTMAVITATEGGHYDAWNGYDVCGWTSGLIQWCERGQFSVSDMLGAVFVRDDSLLAPVLEVASSHGIGFGLDGTAKLRYRFYFKDARGVVDSAAEQAQLFYIHGDGTPATWNAENTLYAKQWAAAISTVWENAVAREVQTKYTADRLRGFMLPYAKTVFSAAPQTALARGLRAAYLSFAANNPTRANNALQKAVQGNPQLAAWSLDWVIAILKEMTFGPQIAIYPHRYDAIRPVLEKLYGLILPDFSSELQAWKTDTGFKQAFTTKQLQRALIALGYDLGPAKDDGVFGKKSRDALLTFERLNGVPEENQDGVPDVHTWPVLERVLDERGIGMPAA